MRYQANIDNGTLEIAGGRLIGATREDLAEIAFLAPQRILLGLGMAPDRHLPVALSTIAEHGPVTIDAHTWASEPPLPDPDWTDVVDVTFNVDDVGAGLTVVSLANRPDFASPPLTPTPGKYHLRINARNRDTDRTGQIRVALSTVTGPRCRG